MDIILFGIVFAAMVSGWLIGRQVFSVMEKRGSKWANTVSLFTAMISLVAIFMAVVFALESAGGFRR